MRSFDDFWRYYWKSSAGTEVLNSAFREVAESAWYAAQYEVIDATKRFSLKYVEEEIDKARNISFLNLEQ